MSELHSVPGIERRLWSYCGCYFVGKFLFSVLNTPRKRMFRFAHFQFRLVNLGRHHPCLLQHHEPLIVKPLEHGSTARQGCRAHRKCWWKLDGEVRTVSCWPVVTFSGQRTKSVQVPTLLVVQKFNTDTLRRPKEGAGSRNAAGS